MGIWLRKGDCLHTHRVVAHVAVADVAVASYIKYGQLFFRMDIGAFPNVIRYMEQVEQREAFQSTVMGG